MPPAGIRSARARSLGGSPFGEQRNNQDDCEEPQHIRIARSSAFTDVDDMRDHVEDRTGGRACDNRESSPDPDEQGGQPDTDAKLKRSGVADQVLVVRRPGGDLVVEGARAMNAHAPNTTKEIAPKAVATRPVVVVTELLSGPGEVRRLAEADVESIRPIQDVTTPGHGTLAEGAVS
jgi:hypothetical protein